MNFSKCGFPIFDDDFDINYLFDKPKQQVVQHAKDKQQDNKPKPKIKPLF